MSELFDEKAPSTANNMVEEATQITNTNNYCLTN